LKQKQLAKQTERKDMKAITPPQTKKYSPPPQPPVKPQANTNQKSGTEVRKKDEPPSDAIVRDFFVSFPFSSLLFEF
jgi:hypothetical protein